jgi:hypothetical protein
METVGEFPMKQLEDEGKLSQAQKIEERVSKVSAIEIYDDSF